MPRLRQRIASPLAKFRAIPRVLVVDDDSEFRRDLALTLTLRRKGYEVVTAEAARDAFAAVEKQDFDLIISEGNMPDTDGHRLMRQLRQRPSMKDVPIILVSAMADSAREVTALDAGADDFLVKDIDPELLLAHVRARLKRSRESCELRRLSLNDELTGVLNRHGLDVELRRELARAKRTGKPMSVLMVDVDDFKRINDTFGHSAGDKALICVARELVRLLRSTDRVGRFGGDEFLVVLPDTDVIEPEMMLDRLHRSFRQHPPHPADVPTVVRVSLGVATAEGHDGDPARVIEIADKEMYIDKRTRRS